MKILAVGDVVGKEGCEYLRGALPLFKKENEINLVIANGENSATGNGMLPFSADYLFDSGVDIITGGNHTFKRREIYDYLDSSPNTIRPANYPDGTCGKGFVIYNLLKYRVCVVNIQGCSFMESLKSPFTVADEILKQIEGEADIIIVDFHAEATSEKTALAHYLDGKISAIFGTHTHIPTADEGILPHKTAYITDIGMTGPINSCLGINPTCVISRYKTMLPTKFEVAKTPCTANGIIMEFNENTLNDKNNLLSCEKIYRITF